MDTKELTDQIYDTLMNNVGMSEHHIPFCLDKVTSQEVLASSGEIYLEIDKSVYLIKVTQLSDASYFVGE